MLESADLTFNTWTIKVSTGGLNKDSGKVFKTIIQLHDTVFIARRLFNLTVKAVNKVPKSLKTALVG